LFDLEINSLTRKVNW